MSNIINNVWLIWMSMLKKLFSHHNIFMISLKKSFETCNFAHYMGSKMGLFLSPNMQICCLPFYFVIISITWKPVFVFVSDDKLIWSKQNRWCKSMIFGSWHDGLPLLVSCMPEIWITSFVLFVVGDKSTRIRW